MNFVASLIFLLFLLVDDDVDGPVFLAIIFVIAVIAAVFTWNMMM